ncbi:MAG TPA: type II/IV secretion system protein, partial [Rubrivivax sp.]|nr:type II/IV secretion system protein [Rubrivivax sp.]
MTSSSVLSAVQAVHVVPAATLAPRGRLEWPQLLNWLRDDKVISADDANRVTARFRAGSSSLHALVRL